MIVELVIYKDKNVNVIYVEIVIQFFESIVNIIEVR